MTIGGFISLAYVVIASRLRTEGPAGVRDIFLLHNAQTGSGTYPLSIQWVPGAVFPG
jgi:hypothetical protein